MLVLFPFEQSIYQSHNIPVEFVGHPLADMLDPQDDNALARRICGVEGDGYLVALLPGSRTAEVKRLAPLFLNMATKFQNMTYRVKFVIPCASQEIRQQIERVAQNLGCDDQLVLLDGQSQTAIRAADLVLLASGTATLEAMLLGKPMVICYQVAKLTYILASRMLKIPYVGLPNLLAGEQLVPEYLQRDANVENIFAEVRGYFDDRQKWAPTLRKFDEIREQLARGADKRAVSSVLSMLQIKQVVE